MPVEIRWAPWALALLLCGCLSGSGSDTETALSGKLVDGNGRGVAGARVLFVPVDNNPLSDSAGGAFPEAKTDAKGVYRFDSLAPGVYNVFGEGKTLVSKRDSVEVVSAGEPVRLDADTLKPFGGLRGSVTLEPFQDSVDIFVLLPGSEKFAQAGAAAAASPGPFRFESLPEGKFEALILTSPGLYATRKIQVEIRSGRVTEAAPIALLPRIPMAEAFSADYDTAQNRARLSWQAPAGWEGAGFIVYQRRPDSAGWTAITSLKEGTPVSGRRQFVTETLDYGSPYVFTIRMMNLGGEIGFAGPADTLRTLSARAALARDSLVLIAVLRSAGIDSVPDTLILADDGARITQVSLKGLGMTAVSARIAELAGLGQLSLANNRLTDLPAEIAELERLEVLDLASNNFDALPAVLFRLAALKKLWVSFNRMGEVPAAISSLKLLEDFKIRGNRLKTLPAEIGGLVHLDILWISDNAIDGLPASITKLTLKPFAKLVVDNGLRLESNRLCTVSAELEQWIAKHQGLDWRTTQTCP